MDVCMPQVEIEREVRATLGSLPEVWGCSHIHLLWDATRGGALVHVDLVMDPKMQVLRAMRIGAIAKQALETHADVLEADVHLELMLPCSSIDSRELLPAEWALPEPPADRERRVSERDMERDLPAMSAPAHRSGER